MTEPTTQELRDAYRVKYSELCCVGAEASTPTVFAAEMYRTGRVAGVRACINALRATAEEKSAPALATAAALLEMWAATGRLSK